MADVSVLILVKDAAGLVVRTLALRGDHLVTAFALSKDPYDPALGPLFLSDLAWSAAFDGRDSQGRVLPNGLYVIEVQSTQGPASATASRTVQVLSSGPPLPSVAVVPGLITPKTAAASLLWSPALAAELSVYSLAGELMRQWRVAAGQGRVDWDLRSAAGQRAAPGVYLLIVRPEGERRGAIAKLSLVR